MTLDEALPVITDIVADLHRTALVFRGLRDYLAGNTPPLLLDLRFTPDGPAIRVNAEELSTDMNLAVVQEAIVTVQEQALASVRELARWTDQLVVHCNNAVMAANATPAAVQPN